MPRYTTISLEELSRSAAEEVTKNAQNWMAFLDTASNIYKYTFDEQLLIHIQRPGIRACATIDIWNDKMRRWLKRGCRGIAILDKSQPEVSLKYVYDIEDTYPLRDGGRTPYLWQLKEAQTEGLIRHLEDTYLFTAPGKALGEALYQVALENVREQFEEYYGEFRYGVENSFLEDLDELNQRKELRETMIYSVYYSLLKRCGLNPLEYMKAEDLTSITQFNTLEALTYLGTATSEICKPILMDMAKAVWQMERAEYEKNQKKDLAKEEKASYNVFNTLIRKSKERETEQTEERGRKNETGNSISDSSGRRLPDSGDHDRADRQGHREIRENEEGLPAGEPQGNLPVSSAKRETGIPPSGNQSAGAEAARESSGRAAEKESGTGQETESDGVGTAHEHAGTPGRGKRPGSDYLQLSLFPTIEEQKKRARQAAGKQKPAAFSISEEEIQEVLRTGSGYRNSLSRICVALSRIQKPEELEEFLRAEYQRGGKGLEINGHKIALWYDRSGISVARGNSARTFPDRHLSWEEVGNLMAAMYQKGEFTTEQIQVQAEVTERQELAEMIYFIFRDGLHHVPERWGNSGEYEKSVFLLAAELADRTKRIEMLDGLRVLSERPASLGLSPWIFRNTKKAMKRLEYLNRDRIAPPQKRGEGPEKECFITQDEVDSVLQAGGNVKGAAGRIYGYFSQWHTAEGEQNFLKNEFGTGGKTSGIPGADNSDVWHDGKGIRLSKGSIQNPDLTILITWEKAAKRVHELVETGQYLLTGETKKTKQAEQPQTEGKVQEAAQEAPFDIESEERKAEGTEAKPEEPEELHQEELSRKETVAELTAEDERNEPEEARANYYLEEVQGLDEGGPKEKFRKNLEALKILKQCEAQKRPATLEEQEILAKYSGWGGLADAFDPGKESWKKEYQELKEILTDEEYQSARSTTLNAHYTPTYIIQEMYGVLERMGFRQGNILDPSMGTGRFFGMLPEKLRDSHLYGVELDGLTGRIARQLYPQAEIEIMGYEKTNFPDDFFDVAISNVPFGNYSVADKKYNKQNFMIHDYFFQKALAQVRPGGVVAFITTKGTLDKASPEVRQALAEKADLLGAVRLPNTAFKESARTEVTSDILFFKKRDTPAVTEPDWVHLGQTENQLPINAYFAEHPEMVLGEMQEVSGPFGAEITCKPKEGENLESQLHNALEKIQGEFTEREWEDGLEEQPVSIPADPEVQNYSFALHEGEVYYRVHSRMEKTTLPAATKERIKGMIALRDCTKRLIDAQLEDQPDSTIKNLQAELNRLYDDFTKTHGLINSSANKRAFSDDASYCLLCSLENLDEEGKLESKADMFTKRTIKKPEVVTSVETASEALSVSISEKAGVDLKYMSELTGKEPEELCRELSGIIFLDPETKKWQNNDEYLSGNIRKKLKIAKEAAKEDSDLEVNVQALQQVIPKDLTASEIDVRMGATWVEPRIYKQFMFELLQTPNYFRVGKDGIDVLYSTLTGQWRVKGKSLDRGNIQAENTYGTKRATAYRIIEDTLNLKDTRIFDITYDIEGKEVRTLNKEQTMLAGQKQEAIKEAFREWIFKDQQRREKLCKTYNERFNSIRPREYDGSYLQFPGMNPEITLRPQQKDGAAHVILGENTLLAHCVGAGKTFTMIASAMESKRLGLCQKNLFVVPNHLTEQWGSDILRLYPGAKVLVSTKKDFEPLNRKKFCSRIATGEYDCVVIGHTQFEKIPLSAERQKAIIQAQINEITEGIEEVKAENGERYTIKQMEKTKKSLLARMERLSAQEKKDNVITFEQLGCDRLFVDESHYYKNCAKRCRTR